MAQKGELRSDDAPAKEGGGPYPGEWVRLFFPMVTSFMCAVAGLESVLDGRNPMGFCSGQVITLEGKIHSELRIEPFEIHQLIKTGKVETPYLVSSLCNMLMNIAYESVKERNDRGEVFEFFRHIRNASSHRNVFHFHEREPVRPARWRTKEIDHTLRGGANPLSGMECLNNYLGIADAILLLWDVEQLILRDFLSITLRSSQEKRLTEMIRHGLSSYETRPALRRVRWIFY